MQPPAHDVVIVEQEDPDRPGDISLHRTFLRFLRCDDH
jgi:hypothetical protein